MSYKHIRLEVSDRVATLVLDREPLNVLNIEMMEEINDALVGLDPKGINLLVFRGNGKAFSAGVDVGEHMGGMAEKMIEVFHGMFRNMARLNVPTIAAVHGAALGGGCELAVFCDMVVASEKAKFGQPEIQVGVYPPIAALLFPRIMGRKKAMELILSGEIIKAEEAKALGLVNHVVSHEDFEAESEKFIDKFKPMSGIVMKHTRKAVLKGLADEEENVLQNIEDHYLTELMKTDDANEGLQAFLDKRKPKWKET
ncbi:MAG: enoyl-CoA hydratase/isomerase family protein [Desulfobacteraceae bacterium]